MKITSALLIVLCISVSFYSCKDKCEAGSGGQLTIVAFPKHHDADTKPLWAYVKYNTQDLPGTDAADFDLVIPGDTSENHIELEQLKCGEYFIYMIAFDPAINDTVVGGIPYSTEQESGEIDLDVPVTE